MSLLTGLQALVVGFAAAFFLTPRLAVAAKRMGVLDRPDGGLKTQREAVPYLGGIAVYLAFLLALCVALDFTPQMCGLLLGGTLMAMLGLFDDLRALPPEAKLALQLVAAWVSLRAGVRIELGGVPQALAAGLSVLWLVGVTNAVNLLDVSDGLATSTSWVALVALSGVAVANGNDAMGATSLALVGALAGFYRFNRAPARIYLGDAGSLFLGYMLAALAMVGTYSQTAVVATLAPLALLCVPLLELTLLTFTRLAAGRAPWQGSPDHFALRLKRAGWNSHAVVRAAVGLGCAGAASAALLMWLPRGAAWALWSVDVLVFAAALTQLVRLPAPARPQAAAPQRVADSICSSS